MDAIQTRFKDHTLTIFERLGMKVVNFWIDGAGQSKLYYVMEFSDLAERQRLWDQFRQDPEWIQVKRNSEKNGGPIVEKIEEFIMKDARVQDLWKRWGCCAPLSGTA
ncbi:NIPSNAP family protein [Paenibacillus sp. LPE1-1-1.1]